MFVSLETLTAISLLFAKVPNPLILPKDPMIKIRQRQNKAKNFQLSQAYLHLI